MSADQRHPLGIGVDIESVERFRKEAGSANRFILRTFTERERTYCMSKADPSMHFAGTFAAKEAALKAVRPGHRARPSVTEFEVTRQNSGAPKVRYTGANAELGTLVIWVSISHTSDTAVAVAIAFLRVSSKSFPKLK